METRLKLIAFDLDYTLWPFRLDTDVVAPFQKRSNGNIVDSKGTKLNCYHEVPGILKSLDEDGFILAIVSRIAKTKAARQLLEIIGWDSFFSFKEIYPGHKSLHFQRYVLFKDKGSVKNRLSRNVVF
ncbi:unnamed protein product [Acanthoscelides obtectus]|uniref:Magnesium-dependent phosphatase 1 n=1 Tax=Acanthoscelides obtectus TaxID=200917 RepID=A0A9P0NZZ3_ACAOB|nr:unnamed protein product [Acanthoscelides obtectus]CAK1654140.1 Magnesium-dependent phosphatase 1 [Acanthoscelides obtectus]